MNFFLPCDRLNNFWVEVYKFLLFPKAKKRGSKSWLKLPFSNRSDFAFFVCIKFNRVVLARSRSTPPFQHYYMTMKWHYCILNQSKKERKNIIIDKCLPESKPLIPKTRCWSWKRLENGSPESFFEGTIVPCIPFQYWNFTTIRFFLYSLENDVVKVILKFTDLKFTWIN